MTKLHSRTFDPTPNYTADAEATMQRVYNSQSSVQHEEACLVQIYPPDVIDGMVLLDDEGILFGRELQSDLQLDDSSVSRQHAKIQKGNDGYYIEDLVSTNGTLVNGESVERTLLKTGDRIQLGNFIFKFLSAGSVESQYHETVYTSMTRDCLTGAMNKRYLLESLQREIARSARKHEPLAVVMIDIDHFKSVNDTHGHLVGDEVLREFGARLLAICREEHLLARYGGEEFSLLMASSSKEEALQLAERCRQVITDTPFATTAGALEISASFGVGCLPENEAIGCLDLIKIADDRLYDAKHQGRNRVVG